MKAPFTPWVLGVVLGQPTSRTVSGHRTQLGESELADSFTNHADRTRGDGHRHAARGCNPTRQVELLRLVASGRSNAEIARELVVSAATVRKHLESIFGRLDVTTRTGAVARAFPATPL